jgi:hypothetical protein
VDLRHTKRLDQHVRRHGVFQGDGTTYIADLVIESLNELAASVGFLPPPSGDRVAPLKPRPVKYMRRVAEILADGEPRSTRYIQDRVTGNATTIKQAIAALVDDGYIAVTDGPRGANLHTLIRPLEAT